MIMDVSIIIVNYNTHALLQQCLTSVFDETNGVDFEVIVVDNASDDGLPPVPKEAFPRVRFIESKENIGFGRANNLGAQQATGRYLFLLNPDTILLNNAVKILADFMDAHPDAGICGGNLYDANRQPAASYKMWLPSLRGELCVALKMEDRIYGKSAEFNHTCHPKKVGYITGADLMISADLFRRLNGFDPDFFMYYEETELTFRVKKRGYAVYSVPQAGLIHLEGQSFSDNWAAMRLLLKSRNVYYKKTQARCMAWCCNGIYRFTALSRCFLFLLTGKRTKYNYWKFILQHLK
jgi:GT2 family glycosyltransferase